MPEAEYETVVLKPTEQQKEIVESLGERAEVVTSIELAPEGTGSRAKSRFARFYNIPEPVSYTHLDVYKRQDPAPDKMADGMAWTRHMNQIKAQAEELVIQEIIYS